MLPSFMDVGIWRSLWYFIALEKNSRNLKVLHAWFCSRLSLVLAKTYLITFILLRLPQILHPWFLSRVSELILQLKKCSAIPFVMYILKRNIVYGKTKIVCFKIFESYYWKSVEHIVEKYLKTLRICERILVSK